MKTIGQRLYVSDLDHTLLQQDATLSPGARRRLTRLLEDGLPFTVASARSLVSMREILGDLPLTLPVIHYNGGFISEWADGRNWFIETLDTPLAGRVIDELDRAGIAAMVSTHNDRENWIYHTGAGNAGMQWYLDGRRDARDDRPRQLARLAESLAEPVVAITAIDTHDRLAPMFERLGRELDGRIQMHFYENQYDRPWHWLSIYPGRATKASALERLLAALGRRAEDLVVFGDGDNDLPMFRLAGCAIAVENATEALKAQADRVIGPNTGDCVVDYIEQDWAAGRSAQRPA